ncbi:MAG: hypothetical protein C5B57_03020 [Blastocatellia bacterium]|nr:MAG: hypothetical protein C5B57_03020 [Blastocatellia bacterium]
MVAHLPDGQRAMVQFKMPVAIIGKAYFGTLIAAATVSGACVRETGATVVASLTMRCTPTPNGVCCHVIALPRNVSQPARDVTRDAMWQLSDTGIGRMSRPGCVYAVRDGNVDVKASYQTVSIHQAVRLSLQQPGQLLGTVHGTVFAAEGARLRQVSGARVEVIRGDNAGVGTTTDGDGGYDLRWLSQGETRLRATKPGFEPTYATITILPRDNLMSLFLRTTDGRQSIDASGPRRRAGNELPPIAPRAPPVWIHASMNTPTAQRRD